MKNKKKCPVCGEIIKTYSANKSPKWHINAKAKQEAFERMCELLKYHKKEINHVSTAIIKRRSKHLNYYLKQKQL